MSIFDYIITYSVFLIIAMIMDYGLISSISTGKSFYYVLGTDIFISVVVPISITISKLRFDVAETGTMTSAPGIYLMFSNIVFSLMILSSIFCMLLTCLCLNSKNIEPHTKIQVIHALFYFIGVIIYRILVTVATIYYGIHF